MQSLYLEDLHYIRNEGTEEKPLMEEELFDVRIDPDELNNLIDSRPQDASAMRAALERALLR